MKITPFLIVAVFVPSFALGDDEGMKSFKELVKKHALSGLQNAKFELKIVREPKDFDISLMLAKLRAKYNQRGDSEEQIEASLSDDKKWLDKEAKGSTKNVELRFGKSEKGFFVGRKEENVSQETLEILTERGFVSVLPQPDTKYIAEVSNVTKNTSFGHTLGYKWMPSVLSGGPLLNMMSDAKVVSSDEANIVLEDLEKGKAALEQYVKAKFNRQSGRLISIESGTAWNHQAYIKVDLTYDDNSTSVPLKVTSTMLNAKGKTSSTETYLAILRNNAVDTKIIDEAGPRDIEVRDTRLERDYSYNYIKKKALPTTHKLAELDPKQSNETAQKMADEASDKSEVPITKFVPFFILMGMMFIGVTYAVVFKSKGRPN